MLLAIAVIILGVLFVTSPPDNFGKPVKVSTVGLETDINYQILGAKLRGVTEIGHRFDFSAESIDPVESGEYDFTLEDLEGTLFFHQKDNFYITSKRASINTNEKYIDLFGKLKIMTDSGTVADTEELRINLKSDNFITSDEITLKTPFGLVSGGSMTLAGNKATNFGTDYLFLNNGVKVKFELNKYFTD